MSKIVNFPDHKIVRQETAVSFDDMNKFLVMYDLAEQSGAIFDDGVTFESIDDFERFVYLVYEELK